MQTHNRINSIECNLRMKKFSTKQTLKRHLVSHDNTREKYKCNNCSKEFFHKSDLIYHLNTVHNKENQIIKCDKCEKAYKTMKLLKIHYNEIHKKLKPYACNICGIAFGQPIQLFRYRKKEVIYNRLLKIFFSKHYILNTL